MRYDITIGVNVRAYRHAEVEANSEEEARTKARALWERNAEVFEDCEDSGSEVADVEAFDIVDVESLQGCWTDTNADACARCDHRRDYHDDTIGTACLADDCECIGWANREVDNASF